MRLRSLTIVLLMFCTPTYATEILCQMNSWFNTNNDSGSANFNFTFEFVEADGRLVAWQLSSNCPSGQAWQEGNSIRIKCETRNQFYGQLGLYQELYDINRYSGYVSTISGYERGDAYTVYEGSCGAALKKF
jgi:hypothetical protein